MQLHLINGFLGSGKTTAIISATKDLLLRGKSVGIVTNDKGQFQVDSAFFQGQQIPTRQVIGGCFRCSFNEFEEKIIQLQTEAVPDVIFAESVGSCVDLVNTIFSPLQNNSCVHVETTTYTVFADIRLFARWLQLESLPFSDRITYLFEKQIEESELLVLNKSDLFSIDRQKEIMAIANRQFPEKRILLQNSLDPTGILPWLNLLENQSTWIERPGFDVDYQTYKSGEKEMAWLDQKFSLESQSPEKIRRTIIEFIHLLLAALQTEGVLVGHVKLLLSCPDEDLKLSFTTADFFENPIASHWQNLIPGVRTTSMSVILNARVAMDAGDFSTILKRIIHQLTFLPDINILLDAGFSYNPEMSLQRPILEKVSK